MARRAPGLLALALLAGCNLLNRPPTADLAADPTSGPAPLAVVFSVSATDPDGDALACTLDFGDGSPTLATCRGQVKHEYRAPGAYTATLRVGDGHGNEVGRTRSIQVSAAPEERPPAANDDAYATDEDTPLRVPAKIGVLANDTDPNGDPLAVTDRTDPAHGTLTLDPEGSFVYTPSADYSGLDAFTYAVSDGRGGSARARVTLTVRPVQDPPTAALTADRTLGTAPLTVRFTRNATDPDGDALACTLDFGDQSDPAPGCGGTVAHTYANAGEYTAVLTVADGHGHKAEDRVLVEVQAPPPAGGGFRIRLVYVEEPADPEVKQAFENAAARWAEAIVGDLPDVTASIPAGACGNDTAFNGPVDDLVIFVKVGAIDGPGGILGQAGPCYLRGGSYLPYAGTMAFDAADLDGMKQNGTLTGVILHEMGHVLGIGTLWDAFGYLSHDASSCQNSTHVEYTGTQGVTEWHALGGGGAVPVENTGGAGTKCGHWREATFGDELMTGWVSPGDRTPMSRVTVASLEDLGYRVDYAAADPYRLPTGTRPQGAGIELKEILIRPRLP